MNQIILQYLSVILTWPVLASVFLFTFIYKFSGDIKDFLKNNKITAAGPGGVTFEQARQDPGIPRTTRLEEGLENKDDKTKEESSALKKQLESLSGELDKKTEEARKKDQLFQFQRQISEINEFAYLNLFFVPNTKSVLKWFYHNSALIVSRELYNLSYQQIIPDNLQRETILGVLVSNGVLSETNGNFKINEKGIRFLKFAGLIKE